MKYVRTLVAACGMSVVIAATFAFPAAAAEPTQLSGAVPLEAQPAHLIAVRGTAQPVDKLVMASAARARGEPADQIAAILSSATSGCWDDWGYVRATNIIGQTLYQYNESHHWCGNGSAITYTSQTTYPSGLMIGWAYINDTQQNTYGVGWNVWIEHLTAHFCFVQYFNCVINNYPWIEWEVGASGQKYYWHYGW